MSLLIVNAGSSSLRVAYFTVNQSILTRVAKQRFDLRQIDAITALRTFISQTNIVLPFKVAHRFVHGGAKFHLPTRITPAVYVQLQHIIPLAPLHNPFALKIIDLLTQEYGNDLDQIAVFDTGFHHDLPAVAKTYALPATLCEQHDLFRYGFHGYAHESLYLQWQSLTSKNTSTSRVITAQLGSGCSVTALMDGKSIDTSMGFTPLEGLVMGTRTGDIGAGLVLYLQTELGYTAEQLNHLLNEQSGLLGISGHSADMRELVDSHDEHAQLAVEIFCYRVRKYLGSYLSVLGGADAIVFGGGIGENMPAIRARILQGMQWCGIHVDEKANQANSSNTCISARDSSIEIWAIKTDEEQLIAQAAHSLQ